MNARRGLSSGVNRGPGPARQVAVVGAGWAGCAAAVELVLLGHQVHLIEASRAPGGRARAMRKPAAGDAVDSWEAGLDNGQHILLGAYDESLRLMREVGVDVDASMLRLPLQMRYPPDRGGMDFLAPRLPAPLHLLVALLRAAGLERADKLALARFSTAARWIDWRLNQDCPVAELLDRFDQSERLTQLLWRPLCLAALNTPPDRASAQVFLNVLRDSLGARRAASDMLIPRVDLGALFPEPTLRFIASRGAHVASGVRITALSSHAGRWHLTGDGSSASATAARNATEGVDAVILATPAAETARLLKSFDHGTAGDDMTALSYEPITTCYLQYAASCRLALPFYALVDDPTAGAWGQFVFDRGHLNDTQAGLLAVVISAASAALFLGHDKLAEAVCRQLAAAFGNPALLAPQRVQVISEKRATFSCTPGLRRPPALTCLPNVVRAGDYVQSDYPATIETAVRSGVQAARLIDEGKQA